MIDLYTWTTPNGRKISIALEEMGLPYTVHAVDIGKDEQFKPEFLKISPNNRIPAIVDRDNGLSLMESGAILIYLADKCGKLMPKSGDGRYKVIEWLMWQMGGPGPMLGQVHHFVKYNKGKAPYAEERYTKEAHRLYGVMNKRLADHEYLADQYSIADIAVWPWISRYEWQEIDLKQYPNVLRWYLAIANKPATQKGYKVPKDVGEVPIPKMTEMIAEIAAEALAAIDGGQSIASFSARYPNFTLAHAYEVTAAMRRTRLARGERAVGRKIGFTNRTIWHEYNVYAPMWGTMYNTAVRDIAGLGSTFPLARLAEPRIEPEIVFGMASAPKPSMDDAALLGTIAWVAHGFEIVQSIFPAWKFTPADTVAANGLHGALMIGPRAPIAPDFNRWLAALSSFEIDLLCNGAVMDRGHARNVMDGPLNALRHLLDLLAADPDNPALAAGEIITTGTLTRALPIQAGEIWSTELTGVALPGVSIRFA